MKFYNSYPRKIFMQVQKKEGNCKRDSAIMDYLFSFRNNILSFSIRKNVGIWNYKF